MTDDHKSDAGWDAGFTFTADRIERISLDTIIAENAQITAVKKTFPSELP